MNRFLATVFCLSILCFPAQGQERQLKSGLNYTTLGNQRAAAPASPAPEAVDEQQETSGDTQSPATQVWNTYRELATGQAGEQAEDQQDSAEKPQGPEKPAIDKPVAAKTGAQGPPPAPPTGSFGAILQQWQDSRDKRREMRSKSFNTPKPAQPAEDAS